MRRRAAITAMTFLASGAVTACAALAGIDSLSYQAPDGGAPPVGEAGAEAGDAGAASDGPVTGDAVPDAPGPDGTPACVVKGTLFAIGGSSDLNQANGIVYRASICESGDLGPWDQEAASLPAPLFRHAACALGGRVFAGGGMGNTGEVAKIYVSQVANGTLQVWYPLAADGGAVWRRTCAAGSSDVYFMGGQTLVGVSSTLVDRVHVDAMGIASVESNEALPVALQNAAATFAAGKVWVIGGNGDGASYNVANTWVGEEAPDGKVHFTMGPILPNPVANAGAAALGHRVVVTGGLGSVPGGNVYALDTTMPSNLFTTLPTALSPPRMAHGAVAFGSHLYLVGGVIPRDGGAEATASVQIGTEQANGDIAWREGPSLPSPQGYVAAVALAVEGGG